jgi:hypothetical protein
VLTPLDGQRYPATPRRTPRPLTPPGLRAGWPFWMRQHFYLPSLVWPLTAPPPPRTGRVVGASLPAGSPSKRPQLISQSFPVSNSPSWADIVRNGKSLSPRRQLQPQLPKQQQLLRFSPYTSAVSQTLRPVSTSATTRDSKKSRLPAKCQPPPPQPRDVAVDALVNTVWSLALQCLCRPVHLRPGPSPRRPNRLLFSHRRRPPRLRPRSGRGRRQKDAAR